MITLLITLLVIALVCYLVWLAVHKVMAAWDVDKRAQAIVGAILLLIFALVVLEVSGMGERWLR
jgi:hypothetical protein